MSNAYNGGINKMGLGIDELCDATINFARKNYADLMPDGGTKKVGNTIKSRAMAEYLKKFLDNGINLLLHGKGKEFIDSYYDYIRKIYNYQIPIKEIASKGKIKKSLPDYINDCKTTTKSGAKKARQAWYELAIQNGLNVNVNDTIYYINTGTKKNHPDVKRVTHYYMIEDGKEVEIDTRMTTKLMKAECEKEGIDYKTLKTSEKKERLKKYIKREEDEIILSCKIIPNEIIESENDVLCSDLDGYEYNVDKYISQFNSRIKTLLVCFHPDIRDKILVDDPSDIPYFTAKETELVAGFPNNETDQDTYEALMTPEEKEVAFWLSINETPPFIKECGIDWDKIVDEYKKKLEFENEEVFKIENEKYLEIIDNLSQKDVDDFIENGTIPSKLNNVVYLNSSDMCFYFKNLEGVKPSTGGYIFDDIQVIEKIEDEE